MLAPLLDETITVDGRPLPRRLVRPAVPASGRRDEPGAWHLLHRRAAGRARHLERPALEPSPGATVERGETLEQTLARELWEEACARVMVRRYIGCQRVDELDEQGTSYYQTRFWARVELEPFTGEHEMTARRLVWPEEFTSALRESARSCRAIRSRRDRYSTG
jgi:ADP-ribose pyrophosphatase YjhB (NUDIX family)